MSSRIFNIYYVIWMLYTQAVHSANQLSGKPIVTTPLGQIRGTTLKTRLDTVIYTFRGIRYAEAPTGPLRFKPPVPVKRWTHVHDATKDPPACPQPHVNHMSEDCLFLNVYTTTLSPKGKQSRVLVFFHPGGFVEGSCSSSIYGPQYLLDKNVVLVVPNYRLGSLGFLSTGTKEAPGNNGLKDQVAVLKWVKNNIASFNGDPNSVTIAGYGAGGIGVTAHLTSPLSKGLFHRAIAMSGSIFGALPIYHNQTNLAIKQAQLLNCPKSSPEKIVNCLNKKSAKEIADSVRDFNEFLNNPVLKWTPVIEPDFGQERFLTEHPISSLEKGNFAKVPVMLGVTRDEVGYKSFDIMSNETVLEAFDKDYLNVWPIIYEYVRYSSLSKKISKSLRKFYFPDGIDNSSRQAIADLYADSLSGFSINRGAKLLAKHNVTNLYYYLFDYHGKYSYTYYPGTDNTLPYGVSTKDDLLYIFYNSVKTPLFTKDPEDKIVDRIIEMCSNFANTGSPIPDQSDENRVTLGSITWPAFDLKTQYYMDINVKLMVAQKLFEHRYLTWDNLIPLSNHKAEQSHNARKRY